MTEMTLAAPHAGEPQPEGKTLVSLVCPVFNEEENVEHLVRAVDDAVAPLLDRYDFEIVFTDNHSTDRTFELLAGMALADKRIRVIRFSRNFGYQKSITAGYLNCRGACAIQLDADLQDPPAMIGTFLDHWEKGAKVVYGVRRTRVESGWVNFQRKAFYRVINFLSEDPLPLDTGDFRLIDRQIIEAVREMPDSDPYLRGMIASMGFTQVGVPYDRAGRERGTSKFPFRAMMALAVDGIISQSVVPLRLASYTGLLVALAMVLGILGYSAAKLVFDLNWPPGFATTTVLMLLSISLNGLFLGIIGEYLARIYKQVKGRHGVIVEHRLNFD